jgi:hypothetical protein
MTARTRDGLALLATAVMVSLICILPIIMGYQASWPIRIAVSVGVSLAIVVGSRFADKRPAPIEKADGERSGVQEETDGWPPLVVFDRQRGTKPREQPFPYVYVNDDGSVQELHVEDMEYLETEFHPCDGGRPYIKQGYDARTPDGHLRGFLARSELPVGMRIAPAPAENPNKPIPTDQWVREERQRNGLEP